MLVTDQAHFKTEASCEQRGVRRENQNERAREREIKSESERERERERGREEDLLCKRARQARGRSAQMLPHETSLTVKAQAAKEL